MTTLLGVIGDPVAHSLSPLIHRGWIREHGLDADYLAMHVPLGELGDALETLARRGGKGASVTLPHKEAAYELADGLSQRARAIGAVNTLWRPGDGTWQAENTDAPGFQYALSSAIEGSGIERSVADPNNTCLVLGAGGASRAVAYAFGVDRQHAVFCNRTVQRADALLDVYRAEYSDPGAARVCGLDNLQDELCRCSFAVNATSLGHSGQSIEWPPGDGRLVYDLSYGKAADAFLAPARAAGWKTVDGLRMLVAQAAYSFEIWFGTLPDIESALGRAEHALEGVA